MPTTVKRRDILGLPLLQVLPQERFPAVYRWSGSARAIGKQHGAALAREIRAELDPSLQQAAKESGQSPVACARQVWRKYRGLFAEHTPSAIEEIEGIAEGAGLPLEVAFYGATRDLLQLPQQSEGCTAVVCGNRRSTSGLPLIGQTKDTSSPLDRYKLMLLSYDSGLRAISLGYPGWIGNISLNNHGLAWTGNSLYAPAPTGLLQPGSLLKRIFLESKTVEEALRRTQGMRFGNSCFCLADRTGRAVCIEWVEGTRDLIEIGDGIYGHANDILGGSRAKNQSASLSPSSTQRQIRINQLLAQAPEKVSADDFERWFRDHQHSPHSVCRHPQLAEKESTTAAFIANLATLEFRVVVGPPCKQPFRTFSMEEIA